MSLLYVSPEEVTEKDFELLKESGQRAPCLAQHYTALDIAEAIISQRWLVFRCPGGIFAVEKIAERLYVRALNIKGFGWRMRTFRDWMDRLASDMMCDTVETSCFDERLARAMMRIRAKPEAWVMVWQVEGKVE